MDPRRPNYNPDYSKRRASRSPDGVGPTKLSKPSRYTGPRASSDRTLPKAPPGRALASTSQTYPTAAGDRSANDGRRVSNQIKNEQKASNASSIISSETPGPRRRDVPSGSSTPISNYGTGSKQNVPTAPPVKGPTDVMVPANPIASMLLNFSNHAVHLAKLQVHREQAQASLQKANTEHEEMKRYFVGFPIIKEQKTTAKARAERTLKAIQNDFDQRAGMQKQLVENIAALIGQSADVRPTEPHAIESANTVSRADFDLLQRKCGDLQLEIGQLRTYVKKFEDRSSERGEHYEKKSASLEKDVDRLKQTVRDNRGDITEQWQDHDERIRALREDLAVAGLKFTSQLSDIMGKLKSQRDIIEQITTFQSKSGELEKGKHTVSDGDIPAKSEGHASESRELSESVKQLEGRLEALKIYVLGNGNGHEDNSADGAPGIDKGHDPSKRESGGFNLGPVAERLANIEADTKGFAVQLQAGSEHLDNMETSIKALNERSDINVTERLDKVEHDLQKFKGGTSEEHQVFKESIANAINRLDNDVTELLTQRKQDVESVSAIENELNSRLPKLQENLKEIERNVADVAAINKNLSDMNAAVTDLRTQLAAKADKSSFDRVKESPGVPLAFAQQLSRATTPNAGPTRFTPPHLPNSNTNSSAVNGVQTQTNGSSEENGAAQGAIIAVMKRVDKLQEHIDVLQSIMQQLQVRYNNLTTDQVAKAMLDQAAEVWPHAKNFELSIDTVRSKLGTLDRQIGMLQKEMDRVGHGVNAASTAANEAKRTVESGVQSVQDDVEKLKVSLSLIKSRSEMAKNTAKTGQADSE